jgi:hypothetical protein
MSRPFQIRIMSDAGQVVSLLSSDAKSGSILDANITWEKIGGLREFDFTLDRKTDVPLFNSMECELYIDGVKKYTGYTITVPTVESNDPKLLIEGRGFYFKLKEAFLTGAYSSTTVAGIIGAVDFSDSGVNYNVGKIDCPVAVTDIEFNKKDFVKVFDSLLKIANQDFNTTEYVWGVDEEKDLYFRPLSTTPQKSLFEGFQYQDPEVEISDDVVNKVIAYRTTSADPNVTELVNTYEDTGSQDRNGIRERKIVFPDFTDSADIQNIADAVIKRNLDPKKRITIKDLDVGILEEGFYNISVKPEEYFQLVNECDSLDGWDFSASPNMPVTVSQDQVLTGRSSLKFEPSALASGNFAEYTLPVKLNSPLFLRAFVYFDTDPADIQIIFTDSRGSSITLDLEGQPAATADQWLKYTQGVAANIFDGALAVEDVTILDGNGAPLDFLVDGNGTPINYLYNNSLGRQ